MSDSSETGTRTYRWLSSLERSVGAVSRVVDDPVTAMVQVCIKQALCLTFSAIPTCEVKVRLTIGTSDHMMVSNVLKLYKEPHNLRSRGVSEFELSLLAQQLWVLEKSSYATCEKHFRLPPVVFQLLCRLGSSRGWRSCLINSLRQRRRKPLRHASYRKGFHSRSRLISAFTG